jgi:hypothetical protein
MINTLSSSAQTYTNTINYTIQAQSIGSSYVTFSTPLSNNKILLFMTSLFIKGNNDGMLSAKIFMLLQHLKLIQLINYQQHPELNLR